MSSNFIFFVLTFCFLIGGFDYLFGNRLRLGDWFKTGLESMGTLAFSFIGILYIAPLFAKLAIQVFSPVAAFTGVDLSIFTSLFLAPDIGGYSVAMAVCKDPEIGIFASIIVSSLMGTFFSFTFPVALGSISRNDVEYLLNGVLAGLIAIPFGCLAGGIALAVPFLALIKNLSCVILFSGLLSAGIFLFPNPAIKIFTSLGKLVSMINVFGMIILGLNIVMPYEVIGGMTDVATVAFVVLKCGFVLAAAFPMLAIISSLFGKVLNKISGLLGVNQLSTSLLIGNLASNIMIFKRFDELDSKGKVLCSAASLCFSFVFGAQLGFVSSVAPGSVTAFILSKFVAGIICVVVVLFMFRKKINMVNQN